MIVVDRHDLAILQALQRNAELTHAALGEQIHLSGSQVSRRVQRLRDSGVIRGQVALLDAAMLDLGVLAFTFVSLERHGRPYGADFERRLQALPEVQECYSVSGEADYMLRIVARDLPAFSEFMTRTLTALPGVRTVTSHISLQKIKQTTELPLDQLNQPQAETVRVRLNPGGGERG